MSASNKENKLPDKQEQLEFYRAKLLQMSIEYDDAADEVMYAEKEYQKARSHQEDVDAKIYEYERRLEALLNDTNSG